MLVLVLHCNIEGWSRILQFFVHTHRCFIFTFYFYLFILLLDIGPGAFLLFLLLLLLLFCVASLFFTFGIMWADGVGCCLAEPTQRCLFRWPRRGECGLCYFLRIDGLRTASFRARWACPHACRARMGVI